MSRDQAAGIVWVVVAIIYGFGVPLIDERWFTIGGAMFFALLAVTMPIWRQWLPDNKKS